MAFIIADRVAETTITTGTGTLNLGGAKVGFQSFVSGVGDTNTTYYTITDNTDWEVGIGTVTAGSPDTLSRDTVLQSTNSDAAVNWGAGTKDVFLGLPADRVVATNKDNTLTGDNTFTGGNTFSNPVTVANATDAGHAVTKAQLDANTPPDASETVKGIVELATNAETTTGTDTTRAITAAGLASFAKSFSSNGYARLPAGLIIQWGSTGSFSGTTSVSFPLTFPNACLQVLTGTKTTNDAATINPVASSLSTSGFTLGSGTGTSTTQRWIAIGH